MNYRQKYYISIVFFAVSTAWMVYMQNEVFTAGISGTLTAGTITCMIISLVVLVVSILTFIIARSRRDKSSISDEELLIMSEQYKNRKP